MSLTYEVFDANYAYGAKFKADNPSGGTFIKGRIEGLTHQLALTSLTTGFVIRIDNTRDLHGFIEVTS